MELQAESTRCCPELLSAQRVWETPEHPGIWATILETRSIWGGMVSDPNPGTKYVFFHLELYLSLRHCLTMCSSG